MTQTAEIVIGVIVGLFTLLFGVAKVGDYVLRGFHNEHVRPSILSISATISENTHAITALTTALARTDALQREEHAQTRETFDRMGRIIEDHETRITVLEQTPGKPRARITAGKP